MLVIRHRDFSHLSRAVATDAGKAGFGWASLSDFWARKFHWPCRASH